ncbi:hypothetical protein [Rickettsiella endosymbiont of Dermanyssus gallinae]|uniref:hypothetical protein n=1 Tax=Rickettsiella endosymbiont of Dermanyssus gallinae TaxID=2856608 RepID=UPI001C52B7F9|nr:hypothetical protein [Rickettsiella endosymbiont of Dermanyssus gallinae]
MPQASLLILATAAATMEVGKGVMEMQASKAQESALDLQAKQNQLQYQQQTLSNLDSLDKVIQHQTAQMTTRGVAFSSPSFNAIQRNTTNIAAKQQKNLDIQKSILDANIDIEKRNVKNSLFGQLFGDAAGTAMSFGQLQGMRPK